MSLEPKEREEKFSELSSSSSSSMDEKDYVDVHGLIKSAAAAAESVVDKSLNKDTLSGNSEIDAISQLIAKHVNSITDESKTTTTTTTTNDEVKLDHVILREPDSTTNDIDDEANKIAKQLTNISNKIEKEFKQPEPQPQQPQQQQQDKQSNLKTATTDGCPYCAYLDEILTWKNPKISGAIFAALLIILISFASFSLLSIVGFTLLALMTLVGGYRLYALALFKIKGQSDDTIDKLLSMKLSLPKDEIELVAKFIENNGNEYLNKLKKLILWEDFTSSGIAYVISYCIYSLGCTFNTITLLIFLVIDAFTLPKVYKMYKVPIDQFVKKAHDKSVEILAKIREKVPFLNKKKLQ